MKKFLEYLAEATTWQQIYDLNKVVIGANPNVIKPGQQLKMPDGSTYTVVAGDSLSKIAMKGGGAKPAVNVAAPGQPPATAARPELGTIKGATQAIPTGPTAPAAINNGSGVGKSATLDAGQASAAADAMKDPTVSARDKAFLAQMQKNTQAAPVQESLERILTLAKLNG